MGYFLFQHLVTLVGNKSQKTRKRGDFLKRAAHYRRPSASQSLPGAERTDLVVVVGRLAERRRRRRWGEHSPVVGNIRIHEFLRRHWGKM